MPRFSIVIPCFNAEHWIAGAIRSCLAQTAADLELIVVNDGSTDRSRDVARREAASDPRVRVLDQRNRGVGAARNAGLAAAHGEYVNFLDADDLLEADKLAIQGAVLDENPAIDLVFCDGRGIDERGGVVMDHIVSAARFAGPVPLVDLFFAGGQFPPLVPLIRRRAAVAVGGFDEDREIAGWADTHFWLRLGIAGARYHFVDRRLCLYRVRADSMSADRDGMARAAELVYAKLLGEHPAESARALRLLHGRLNDQDAALAGLRTCLERVDREQAANDDQWRVTRECLHAEQLVTRHLQAQLHDANQRLDRLRDILATRVSRPPTRGASQLPRRHHMARIVIYDAGETGRRLWEALAARPTVEVVGFVDPDPRRQGRSFLGAAVHPLDWLTSGGWDQVAVAASNTSEWRFPLAAAGVSSRHILELPLDGGDVLLSELAADLFPDPLARLTANAPASTGVRLGIFGTGAAGMKVWEALADLDSADAVWFADNNRAQQGREILGLDIIAPAAIPSRGFDAVIVASMSRDPICEQLRRLGIAADRILTPNVTGFVDDLRRDLESALVPFQSAEVPA